VSVLRGPELRAEVLRVLHRLTLGMPELTTDDLAGQPLSPAERRLLNAAADENLALANALLALEAEHRAAQFAALETLIAHAQFSDGPLDDRLAALPRRAFGRASADSPRARPADSHRTCTCAAPTCPRRRRTTFATPAAPAE
jgi:hypothetical protein